MIFYILRMINQLFLLQLLIPKMEYNGQKPTTAVSNNIAPTTSKMIPTTLLMELVKYSKAIITAIATRVVMSAEPKFFFIYWLFKKHSPTIPIVENRNVQLK
jgi:hypothetical protein